MEKQNQKDFCSMAVMLLHMENNMAVFQVIQSGHKMVAQVGILAMM